MFIIKNPQTIYSKKSNPTDNRFSRIGQWRKDIAIAYKNDPIYREEVPCLINKEREIIYEGNCNEGYPDEIYRTSKGYYLVYYYKDISAPGKDSRYSGPYLKKVISEDGKSQIWAYGFEYKVFKNEWYDTKDKNVFITKDMGDGIVEHNNSLYRLEDFKKIGDLPKKFKIESIFEDGLCLLSVPKDNRDYFVIVKNGEIDNFFEVNDTNKLISLIDKTNDTSIIKYCTNNKSPIIRVLKKQQDKVDDYIADEFYNYLFSHGRFRISDNPFTAEDFESGIDLDKNEIDFIKNFHWKLSQNKRIEDDERYIVRLRTNEDISDCHILCLFFETFIIDLN
ncbi:MAG: hypothetical protein IKR77_00545 [Bacteroidales bacterium]|nr:hypothetical protein [Bacteroidales bacterium]MBR7066213.1 hypothetical protein [Prevotella sp.]